MVNAVRIAASGLLAALLAGCTTSPGRLAAHRLPGRVRGPFTAFVVNEGSDTVTPFDTATRRVSRPITVGSSPVAIAITPDGRTAYVVNSDSGTVTPIDIATRTALAPITVGTRPERSRSRRTENRVCGQRRLAHGHADQHRHRTRQPRLSGSALSRMPSRSPPTARPLTWPATRTIGTVTPVNLAASSAGRPITVGTTPTAIAILPNGRTAYVVARSRDPIDLATGAPGRTIKPVNHGYGPAAIAITPDGRTAYVSGYFESDSTVESDMPAPMTPIGWPPARREGPYPSGNNPKAIAITPDGAIAFVVNWQSWGMVTPVNTATGRPGKPIKVGSQPIAIAIAPR